MIAKIQQSLSPELFGGVMILSSMAILGLSDNVFYYLEPYMGLGQFHAMRSSIWPFYLSNFCAYFHQSDL